MPKEKVPATPITNPAPLQTEKEVSEKLNERRGEPGPPSESKTDDNDEVEEGGLGPRG